MTALTAKPAGALVPADQAESIRTALKTSLYPGATDESVEMVLAYCRAGNLDPLTKPVHIVPMSVKVPGTRDKYEWRDIVMPGIELYRVKAHRTGEYAGQDEAEFGPTVDGAFDGVQTRYPEWCRVTVYRLVNGQRVPYSARVYWTETYATARRDSDAPNAMWRKRPFGQLEKCAEALALRKAFPEAVGAQPTAEEMEGKVIEVEAAVPKLAMRKELPLYPAEDFAKNLPAWLEVIESGRRSADEIIAMVMTKGRLTEEQVAAIRSPRPRETVEEVLPLECDPDTGEVLPPELQSHRGIPS